MVPPAPTQPASPAAAPAAQPAPSAPPIQQPLPTDMHPALGPGPVAIISGENPLYPNPTGQRGHEEMGRAIAKLGLKGESTRGKYGAHEPSHIVYGASIPQLHQLGKLFGQESVAVRQNGKNFLLYTNGPQEGHVTVPAAGYQLHEQEPDDFYTVIPGREGQPGGHFTWNMDFENPAIPLHALHQHLDTVTPQAAAHAVLKTAVEVYHDVLLGLRSRELKKAQDSVHAPKSKGGCGDSPTVFSDDIKNISCTKCRKGFAAHHGMNPKHTPPKPMGKAQAGEQVAPHREPGIHEASGQSHTEPGIHERPAQTAKPAMEKNMKGGKLYDLVKSQAGGAALRKSDGSALAADDVRRMGSGGKGTFGSPNAPLTEEEKKVAHRLAPKPWDKKVKKGESLEGCECGNADCGGTGECGKSKPVEKADVGLTGCKCGKCTCGQTTPVEKQETNATKHARANGGTVRVLGKSEAGSVLFKSLRKGEVVPSASDIKVIDAEGSGGQVKKGKKPAKEESKTEKAEVKMSTPSAPKPPQAAGAAPTMHKTSVPGGGTRDGVAHAHGVPPRPTSIPKPPPAPVKKALGEPEPRMGRKPAPAAAPAGLTAPHPEAMKDARVLPTQPTAAGMPKPTGVKSPLHAGRVALPKPPMGKSEESLQGCPCGNADCGGTGECGKSKTVKAETCAKCAKSHQGACA